MPKETDKPTPQGETEPNENAPTPEQGEGGDERNSLHADADDRTASVDAGDLKHDVQLTPQQRKQFAKPGGPTPDPKDDDTGGESDPDDGSEGKPDGEVSPDGEGDADDDQPDAEAPPLPPGITAEENSKFLSELEESGGLTEESYSALEEKGYPRELVDGFIQGKMGQAQDPGQAVYDVFGGEEEYENQFVPWARENLEPAEIENFDKLLDEGSISAATKEARKLHNKYVAEMGTNPTTRVSGTAAGGHVNENGLAPIKSQAELRKLMRSDEFRTSGAFQKEVQERVNLSAKLGIVLS